MLFVAFVVDNATMTSKRYFKIMHPILYKMKEVNPIKVNFSMTSKCFDST